MQKKFLIIVGIALIVVVGSYLVYNSLQHNSGQTKEYNDLLKQSASAPLVVSDESSPVIPQQVNLNTMLQAGIMTKQGILKSNVLESDVIEKNGITLAGKKLAINAVSEIDLVKAFLIESSQIILFGYDQGGNDCAKQYQVLMISESSNYLSKPFGSCLPISQITESNNTILISTPKNNPYLGNDVVINYLYQNGIVKEVYNPSKADLRKKYAKFTSSQIIQIATNDGCFIDGVFLDDNSCGGGKKYCTMFKGINKPVKNSDYKLLKNFCN